MAKGLVKMSKNYLVEQLPEMEKKKADLIIEWSSLQKQIELLNHRAGALQMEIVNLTIQIGTIRAAFDLSRVDENDNGLGEQVLTELEKIKTGDAITDSLTSIRPLKLSEVGFRRQ